MAAVTKNKKKAGGWVKLKISSEITGSIETTICLNSPWMILFQHCVRQSRLSINMANVAKIEKGDDILIFSSLKPLGHLDPSFANIILWWYLFKSLSGSPVLRPRWTLLEIK
jgi:hypothetical protein